MAWHKPDFQYLNVWKAQEEQHQQKISVRTACAVSDTFG